MIQPFPLGSPTDSAEAESSPPAPAESSSASRVRRRNKRHAEKSPTPWRLWRWCLGTRWSEIQNMARAGWRASSPAQAQASVSGQAESARVAGWGQAEPPSEAREAELIVALFRTIVLLSVLFGPRLLGVPVTFEIGEIWLAAVAGIYNIVTALGSLLPTRYGLRRPFIVAMDLLLITLWIQISGQWELRPFYVVVVVVAALWFRVFGGVLTAAFCNFFFLFLWFRAAGQSETPHQLITGTLAIHVAMLFGVGCLVGSIAEAQERERERRLEDQLLIANYQREIDLSAQLQPSLIAPQWLEGGAEATGAQAVGQTLPREASLEIGAAMQSARSIGGGDYFDLIPLGEGRTGICIADVSGKSVRAQARLPLLKYSLRALAPLYAQPEKLVERLNETLSPDLQPELYIAFCYVVLDPRAQMLSWCNAGHIAPILLQHCADEAGELQVTRLKTHGPALGMFPDAQYSGGSALREMAWEPGDELLLYTDGLTDALSYRNSEDGEAQLKKLAGRLCEQKDRPARELARELVSLATAILDESSPLQRAQGVLNQISEGGRFESESEEGRHRDDITLVLARFV